MNLDYATIILGFAGGLGLFIYGMQVMASGLQKAAGNSLKKILEVLTKNKFLGVLLGIGVTAIIQSSSATTVMVVGFVNAGLMNLQQTVGIIMGANIGTTVTGWLVSSVQWAGVFSPENLAPIAVFIGAALAIFSKKQTVNQIGEILVGFGMLFIGIEMMSTGVEPLQHLPAFKEAFTWCFGWCSCYSCYPKFISISWYIAVTFFNRPCKLEFSSLHYYGSEHWYLCYSTSF